MRFLSIILASALIGMGEDAKASGTIALQDLGYVERHWTVDEGLPSGFVFWVTQTPDGYIWATTLDGVSRCDGRRFTAFLDPDMTSPRRLIRRPYLQVDNDGQLWIISGEGGAVVLCEDGEFTRMGPEQGIHPGIGILVPGTGSASPYLIRRDTDVPLHIRTGGQEFKEFPNRDLPKLRKLHEQKSDGSLWGLTDESPGRLIQFNSEGALMEGVRGEGMEWSTQVLDLIRNPEGKLSAVTERAVHVQEDGVWKVEREIVNVSLLSGLTIASYDNFRNIWLMNHEGLVIVSPDGNPRRLEGTTFRDGMGRPFCDREGSIWIPSRRGLYQFVPSEFTAWKLDPGPARHRVYDAANNGAGDVWFGGENGLFVLPKGSAQVRKVTGSMNSIVAVAGAADDKAYFLSPESDLFKATHEQATDLKIKGLDGLIRTTRDGACWLSTQWGMDKYLSPAYRPDHFDIVPRNPNSRTNVQRMVEDKDGRIFVSIGGAGLIEMKGPGNIRMVSESGPTQIAKRPFSLTADKEGRVWQTSRAPDGVGIWDTNSEQWHFTEWEKLNPPFTPLPVGSIIADDVGGMWMSSVSGLFRCNLEELAEAVVQGGMEVQWRTLSKADGMPTSACSFAMESPCLDDEGRLWFPTNSGVAMTRPAQWLEHQKRIPPPPVLLAGVNIDDEQVQIDTLESLEVPPGTDLLEITCKALHFANPERVTFRYRLTGHDTHWSEVGHTGMIRYHSLPPGNYQFEVTADNGFGVWNETLIVMGVMVQPMWWERAGVRVAGFLLLILLIVLAYQLRIRSLQRARMIKEELSRRLIEGQEAERHRLASELHDGLGQSLLVIKNGLAFESTRSEGQKGGDVMERYANVAGECLSEVRNLSQDLRPHQLDRLGLKVAIESVADRLSESSRIPIKHEVDEVSDLLPVEMEIHVLRIVQEALGNAVRHADASEIGMSVKILNNHLHINIKDDGKGFDQEEAGRRKRTTGGLGLVSMEERARIVNGDCRFTSAPGQGTVVSVQIPIPKKPS